ncbi:unnamed protein product [Didymodactylos carnosus]|uniref:Uncharacterized protein n=1 Tax=Didymodactylos carnosus TaxID=1234261 RepID=A0A8S2F2X0_9BILA|nr:unnamed protein product [Didymodactylos carnosus]CAF4117855.1 unnamed protein product [Didymodactylos carnosus]
MAFKKHQRKKAKYSHHHYSFKEKVKRFIHDKPSRQNDQSHLASLTSSFSSSSIDQKQRNHFSPTNMPYTVQNNNTVLLDPSATTSNLMNNATLPSKRFQQSIMDAYLKDLQSFHPNAHPRQMNSYLFIDLHSTSSETFPDGSGDYEASTTNTEDAIEAAPRTNNQNGKYQKRILSGKKYRKQHRQKRFLNTNNGPRFLMRERQLPVHMLSLPQLRSISNFQNNNTTTSINTINQDSSLTSTEFSSTDDDFDNSHAYHLNQNQMKAIEEEVEDETEHHPTFCSFEHQRTTSTVQSTETNQIQNRFKYFQKRQSVPIKTVPSMTLNANVLLDQSKFSRHTHNHSQNILVQNNNSSEQQQQQQQYFEKVSTSRGDDSDTSFLNDEWKQFKIMQPGDGIAYINDSILV